MVQRQETIDSAISYSSGVAAMTLPHIISMATEALQFLTILCGFLIVVIKLLHDIKKYRKK